MTTPTEIELPCGVVLTADGETFVLRVGLIALRLRPGYRADGSWTAEYGSPGMTDSWLPNVSQPECIAWLNEKALELRAALAPKDALLPGDADRDLGRNVRRLVGTNNRVEIEAWGDEAIDFVTVGAIQAPTLDAAVSQALAKGEG